MNNEINLFQPIEDMLWNVFYVLLGAAILLVIFRILWYKYVVK